MKTYNEKQLSAKIGAALKAYIVQEAAALSRYNGSTQDAAEQMLKGARLTKADVRRYLTDAADRRRLCAYLGPNISSQRTRHPMPDHQPTEATTQEQRPGSL